MDIRTAVPTVYGDWLSRFGESWSVQVKRLESKFGEAIEKIWMPSSHLVEVPVVFVKKERLIEVLRFLKEESEFCYDFLSDLTATDEGGDRRFEVVYNLFSTSRFWRIRVKCCVKEEEKVPTAIALWKGANWAEREVFDMFGVRFEGHPDLRRILMDERWVGHPLRKDYPLRGYQVFATPETIDPELLK